MNLRQFLLWFHLVTGLAAALILVLLGASGAEMVFENEIDHALNASLYRVQPQDTRLSLDELVTKAESANPGARATLLNLPDEDGIACVVSLKPPQGKTLTVTTNPYTGEVIGSLEHANSFTKKVHQFHLNLLLQNRETGSLIQAWGSVLLIGLAITGIVLWWPRKLWSFGGRKATGRWSFDLHNVLGFYTSVFMLIFGITGVVIHWENQAMQLVGNLSGQPLPLPPPKPSPAVPGAKPLTASAVWTAATKAVPGAKVVTIQNLGSVAPLRVTMRFPEDRTPAGRTNVYLHPTTGEVLSAQSSRTAPAPYRLVKLWNRQFHTGDILGWPSRIIAALASASLPFLAITGPWIWVRRLIRKRKVTP